MSKHGSSWNLYPLIIEINGIKDEIEIKLTGYDG
jgi:hypothetical protein